MKQRRMARSLSTSDPRNAEGYIEAEELESTRSGWYRTRRDPVWKTGHDLVMETGPLWTGLVRDTALDRQKNGPYLKNRDRADPVTPYGPGSPIYLYMNIICHSGAL